MNTPAETPGARLKAAREALGKTTSEMALKTRITVQQLQGLEADNYDSIPAPMYVRGFMKLYAHELGLDPKPLVDEYERLRKGTEAPGKPVRPSERPAPAPVPEPEENPTPPASPEELTSPPESVLKPSLSAYQQDEARGWQGRVEALREWLPESWSEADWWKNSWIPRMTAGILILFGVLLFSRGCTSKPQSDEPRVTPTPPPPAATGTPPELPGIENPLLKQPSPLFFELPRTLE